MPEMRPLPLKVATAIPPLIPLHSDFWVSKAFVDIKTNIELFPGKSHLLVGLALNDLFCCPHSF